MELGLRRKRVASIRSGSLFVRIEGPVERDALGWAIRRAVCVPLLGCEEDPPMALPLEASDEPNRYFIQL
jgi:hypothetical protein